MYFIFRIFKHLKDKYKLDIYKLNINMVDVKYELFEFLQS